jgi:hypothetical protein
MSDSEMTYDPAPVVIDTKAEVAPEAQMYDEEIAAPATVETAPFDNDQETTSSQKIEEEVEAPEPIEPAQPKKYTANDVFGDDDDDSDLSSEDDEDDGPSKFLTRLLFRPVYLELTSKYRRAIKVPSSIYDS